MLQIAIDVKHQFNEDQKRWESEATPTVRQSFPGYYECPEHGTLHEDDLTTDQADGTSGRCPECNKPVDHKEDAVQTMKTQFYEADSICEVNSALETNALILQRHTEEEGENLRQAEEDRRNKTVHITRVNGEEAADAKQEPEAG